MNLFFQFIFWDKNEFKNIITEHLRFVFLRLFFVMLKFHFDK